MAKKSGSIAVWGRYAFIVGVILAVLMGIIPALGANGILMSILVLLGLLVGLLNITVKESTPFLIAATILVIVAGFGGGTLASVQYIGVYLRGILGTLITLVVPAAIVVALKELYSFGQA